MKKTTLILTVMFSAFFFTSMSASAEPFGTYAECLAKCNYLISPPHRAGVEEATSCVDKCWDTLKTSVTPSQKACLAVCEEDATSSLLGCISIQKDEDMQMCMQHSGAKIGNCILSCKTK